VIGNLSGLLVPKTMKYCPKCALEFRDDAVLCSRDGSQLFTRISTGTSQAVVGLGKGAIHASSALSQQTGSPLAVTMLEMPTPPKGTPLPSLRAKVPQFAQVNDASDTEKGPRKLPCVGPTVATNLAVEENQHEFTTRQPAVSTEMRTVAAAGGGDDSANELPTIAMKSPVHSDAQQTLEPSLVGMTIAGRYSIVRQLGEGGMGVVYQAVDQRLEKPIALKVLREDFARRADVVARFTQEAKSAARIKHENVLDVTDYGQTEDGSFYIAMELLKGTDLADVLQSEGVVPYDRLIEIGVQICRALAAAHSKGIVHRDLKPENVFLVRTDDGREVVKIVDFGIAQMKDISGSGEGNRKLTRTGMIFGTPEYMSPEQASGKPVDHRVDIYAVGVILYEMCVGRVPFLGDSFMGILTQHMFEVPPPLAEMNAAVQVSPDFEAVIFKALAKDPAQRYASMLDLNEDLLRLRTGQVTEATRVPPVTTGAYQSRPMVNNSGTVPGALPVGRTLEYERDTRKTSRTTLVLGGIALLLLGITAGLYLALGVTTTQPSSGGQPTTPPAPVVRPPEVHTSPAVAVPDAASPTVPTTAAQPVPVAPTMVHVRVVASDVPANAVIQFAYTDNAAHHRPIAPCNGTRDCVREVVSGVSLRVWTARRRGVVEATVTPTHDNQEIRLSGRERSGRNENVPVRVPPGTRNSRVPCNSLDPATGLIRICVPHR
jgi:eukaryotic-like serine/threonine-protein kinase